MTVIRRSIFNKDSFVPQGLLKLLISGEPQARHLYGIIYDDFRGKRRGRKNTKENQARLNPLVLWFISVIVNSLRVWEHFFQAATCGIIPFIARLVLCFSFCSFPCNSLLVLFLLYVHDQGEYLDS